MGARRRPPHPHTKDTLMPTLITLTQRCRLPSFRPSRALLLSANRQREEEESHLHIHMILRSTRIVDSLALHLPVSVCMNGCVCQCVENNLCDLLCDYSDSGCKMYVHGRVHAITSLHCTCHSQAIKQTNMQTNRKV